MVNLLALALGTLLLLTTRCNAVDSITSDSVICVCRCCYQGNCNSLSNVSWAVDSCSSCQTSMCNEYIASSVVRSKTARLFESLENNVPAGAKADLVVDVCEVITVLETATCTGSSCKRSTNLKAECYNRNTPLIKYTIQCFVFILITGVLFGFVKNFLPALQDLNTKYFNY